MSDNSANENETEQYVWVIASASARSFDPHIYEVWAEDYEETAHDRAADIREEADPEDHITCTLQRVQALGAADQSPGGSNV